MKNKANNLISIILLLSFSLITQVKPSSVCECTPCGVNECCVETYCAKPLSGCYLSSCHKEVFANEIRCSCKCINSKCGDGDGGSGGAGQGLMLMNSKLFRKAEFIKLASKRNTKRGLNKVNHLGQEIQNLIT